MELQIHYLMGQERSFCINALPFPSCFTSAAAQGLEPLAVAARAEGGKRAAALPACCLGPQQVGTWPAGSPGALCDLLLVSRSHHSPFPTLLCRFGKALPWTCGSCACLFRSVDEVGGGMRSACAGAWPAAPQVSGVGDVLSWDSGISSVTETSQAGACLWLGLGGCEACPQLNIQLE